MTIEDFTSYTEVDPGTQISTSSTRVTFTALSRAADAYLYKDYGAGYFSGQAYLEGEFQVTGYSGASPKSASIGFSDSLNDTSATTNQCGNFHRVDGTNSFLFEYAYLREGGADAGSISGAVDLAFSTTHYYRTGFYSCIGGQYGAVLTQVFSDSGRATLVESIFAKRNTGATYQYVIAAQSYNNGTANTITGYDENVTVFQPAAGIDLTTGTETDASARLAPYADCIVVTALSINSADNAATHIAIDEGAAFFGDYTVSGVLNITAFTNGTAAGMFQVLTVCDAASDAAIANDSQGIVINWVSATTYQIQMHQSVAGADTFSSAAPAASTLNANQPYSFTLSRSGTTLTMKVWNDLVLTDFAGTSQVGSTVTWTGRATTTYRYLMPVASYLNGATSRSSTFTLGGVKRTGGVNTASHTSDGGFVIGGSATNSRSAYATGSGGILLGGSATNSRSTAYIATGGFIIGGAADFSANGAASVSYTSSGGFIIGGTAANSRSSSHTGSGGFRLGGSAAYSFTLQTNVQEIVFELYDSTGAPITGATTLTCKLRTTPGAQIYDWSDETFKSSGWTTIATALNEIDATNLPGVYKKEIDVSNFADGRYQVFISYSATQSQHGSIEFLVDDGQMVDEYTATNTHTALIDIAATPAAVLAAATTTPIAANIKQVNDVTIQGAGISGNSMRPV